MPDYINRADLLFELETGFFPQDMEYTRAVEIAKSLIKSAPGVDAVVCCKDCETAKRIFKEIEEATKYFEIPNGCAIISLEQLAELKKKYIGDSKDGT